MIKKEDSLSEKIKLLNKTTYLMMHEDNVLNLIKNYTETSKEILEADMAFAWWKFNNINKLAYRSTNISCEPTIPSAKASFSIPRTGNVYYDVDVLKKNYKTDFCDSAKSFLLISIHYGEHVFGSLVFCYKQPRNFSKEELNFANLIGNTIAQSITIQWIVESEKDALELAGKQKATETLLAQEKLKTEFIANATHELRTPLAIMKGNIDLALMGKLDLKSAKAALTEVDFEIKRLAAILSDLVLITTENKKFEIISSFAPVEIIGLIDIVAKRLRVVAKQKNITISLKSNKLLGLYILGEEKFLEKLFLNVIKNAITYGKENGHIYVEVSQEKDMAKIKIADDGIGIAEEDLPKIFERFYRADKAHAASNHSGLGLAIANWVAKKHKGMIKVESTLGKGSTFTITLPLVKND